MIQNPILPGFSPDPSIIRVGDDYYIATSTFEWFPGVCLYHSRDLKNWRQLPHPLRRTAQIDLRGVDTAQGVWAPCLSYDEQAKLFYLVYTNVTGMSGQHFDLDNFMVTSPAIDGEWSDPVFVNSSGFDPSLFHDEDGRKWIVNLEWETRQDYEQVGSIVLQEWSVAESRLIGEPTRISKGGTERGCVEAPHLYKRDGFYYLMTAEGGTGYGHAVVLSRSRCIEGPYEVDPQGAMITSHPDEFNERGDSDSTKPHRYNPDAPLQKAGHGSLVETQQGEWYVPHLCSRPLVPELRSMLGRETAIQKCVWTPDGWLRMADGSNLAKAETPEPVGLEAHPFERLPVRDDFDEGRLDVQYQTCRVPADSWLSFERPGFLRLRGQGSLFSKQWKSLVARRIQHVSIQAETCLEFEPWHTLQSAGLTAYYSEHNFYMLRVYRSESLGGTCLGIMMGNLEGKEELLDSRMLVDDWERFYLRLRIEHKVLQFFASPDGEDWTAIGPELDATILSDEYGSQKFTGAFVGLFAQDLHTKQLCADFDYFEVQELGA